MSVEVRDGRVRIDGLECSDAAVVRLVASAQTGPERERLVADALATGARGMMSMGLGLRIEDAEDRIKSAIEATALQATRRLDQAVAAAMSGLDPDRADSHPTRLLTQLEGMFASDGRLLCQLRDIFDLQGDSPLARAYRGLQSEVLGLREELARQQGRVAEARRGTAKGFEYEQTVENHLRQLARGIGAVVEQTARSPGHLSSMAVVGDYLLTLADGTRIVVEVKNQQTITLGGKSGILHELDRAIANRGAHAAICVSAEIAFPEEVGVFGIYGNRILVVDDGEGTMITAALRWITAASGNGVEPGLDTGALADGLQRLRSFGQQFSSQRTALTEVNKSVGRVAESLTEMRSELLGLVDDLIRLVRQDATTNTPGRRAG